MGLGLRAFGFGVQGLGFTGVGLSHHHMRHSLNSWYLVPP